MHWTITISPSSPVSYYEDPDSVTPALLPTANNTPVTMKYPIAVIALNIGFIVLNAHNRPMKKKKSPRP
jgi:hypothetical protein